MMAPRGTWGATSPPLAIAALVLAFAVVAAGAWWLAQPPGTLSAPGSGAAQPPLQGGGAGTLAAPAALPQPATSAISARRAADALAQETDSLLAPGLRDSLEALLLDAGDAPGPSALKQKLAGLVGRHFPPDLATRALALAERYVDYRVALGRLRAPQDLGDPAALRQALTAREAVRRRFFDAEEAQALFAREAALDRYTLARLEIAHNGALSAEQRAQALREAEAELPADQRAARQAATSHMAVAEQTAAFDTQGTDERSRHAARSALYGDNAAHALAQLDRQEQHWQQRLDQYAHARGTQPEPATLDRLRQQLFTPDEQLRLDAALALRMGAARNAPGG